MKVFQEIKQHRRSFLVAAIINTGAILFGFDAGGIGAVISLHSFGSSFDLLGNPHKLANTSGTVVTLLNAGGIVGSLLPLAFSKYLGRRYLLMIAGFFFLVGGILQTASITPSLSMMYAGRTIAGVGVGAIGNVAPLFMAECAPKQFRGFLMSLFDLYLIIGAIIGYFAVYGCSLHLAPKTAQWRIPLSLQVPLSVIVFIGAYFLDESPRWLARNDRWEEATASLCRLRGRNQEDLAIAEEMAEMRAQITTEYAATKDSTFKEIFQHGNWQRLLWASSMAVLASSCGHNSILYYAPIVFKEIGYVNQNSTLFASGVILIIKLAAVILFLLGPVEYFGRRSLLMTGTFGMSSCLFVLSALFATSPQSGGEARTTTAAGRAMVAMVYVFQVFYSISWGPLLWVYLGEIFPNRIRDYGMGPCVALTSAFNLLWSKLLPILLLNIGWKTWLIFASINIVGTAFCYALPETKGSTLEELDIVFGVVDEQTRKNDIEATMSSKAVTVESVTVSKV